MISTGLNNKQAGFSAVEFLVAAVVFGIMATGIVDSYNSIKRSYSVARQLNEIYAVLSACPEIDRALEFNSLSSTNNCYPNNTFVVEDGVSGTVSYQPSLTVVDTPTLPASDPLRNVPDSKIVSVSVPFPNAPSSAQPYQLRMLITRNGVGQQ
jgi:prepilin-type N-terminal cleavage/methylation domain-containing protein